MAKQRVTFLKRQRELDKQRKQADKRDRRAARAEDAALAGDDDAPPTSEEQQARIMEALAHLQLQLDEGALDLDEFEARREALRSQLRVD